MKPEALMAKVKSRETAEALARKANYGLAENTKESYRTAINHLRRCEEDSGVDMSLPFDDNKTLQFLGWMEARGLKSQCLPICLGSGRST